MKDKIKVDVWFKMLGVIKDSQKLLKQNHFKLII